MNYLNCKQRKGFRKIKKALPKDENIQL